MESVLKKVSSRKFIVAVSGVVSGIVLVANGSTTEGVTAIVTSVVAYLAAEGLVASTTSSAPSQALRLRETS